MPGKNIHLKKFIETVMPFLHGATDSTSISSFVSELDVETMCNIFLDGNTMLSKLIQITSLEQAQQGNYVINLLIDQAELLDIVHGSSIIKYLMTHKNNLGNNLLHSSIYYSSNQSFNLLLDKLIVLREYINSSGDCGKLIMSPNKDGYNSLGWLLTLGNEDKLSMYLLTLHNLIERGSLSENDYRSLIQSQQIVPYDSYVVCSKLDVSKRQISQPYQPFVFTTFMLALMSSNKKTTAVYISELVFAGSKGLLSQNEIISLLLVTSEDGYRVLDRLALYGSSENFDLCLIIFEQAFELRLISQDEYFDLIFKHTRPGHSLLHELIMSCNIEKIKSYTELITSLMNQELISEYYYLDVFLLKNVHGYAAFHQAVNSFSRDISLFVIDLLKRNLSEENYMQALTVKAEGKKNSYLKSIDKQHSKEINILIASELRQLKFNMDYKSDDPGYIPEYAPTPDYFRFFPARVITQHPSFEEEIQLHSRP